MESHGIPGRIHVTEDVYRRLERDFTFERRGEIEVKGKGRLVTYLLSGRHVA
jgi:class 3 adenylate cyclase